MCYHCFEIFISNCVDSSLDSPSRISCSDRAMMTIKPRREAPTQWPSFVTRPWWWCESPCPWPWPSPPWCKSTRLGGRACDFSDSFTTLTFMLQIEELSNLLMKSINVSICNLLSGWFTVFSAVMPLSRLVIVIHVTVLVNCAECSVAVVEVGFTVCGMVGRFRCLDVQFHGHQVIAGTEGSSRLLFDAHSSTKFFVVAIQLTDAVLAAFRLFGGARSYRTITTDGASSDADRPMERSFRHVVGVSISDQMNDFFN